MEIVALLWSMSHATLEVEDKVHPEATITIATMIETVIVDATVTVTVTDILLVMSIKIVTVTGSETNTTIEIGDDTLLRLGMQTEMQTDIVLEI